MIVNVKGKHMKHWETNMYRVKAVFCSIEQNKKYWANHSFNELKWMVE